MLLSLLAPDVWAEVALQMLDVRDLIATAVAAPLPALPTGASFVARRVLLDSELGWFADRGIPVTLLKEEATNEKFLMLFGFACARCWRLNGQLHRENDLPAIEWACGKREWWVHGRRHRDNDRPAVDNSCSTEWWVDGKLHREYDLPAVVRFNNTQEWYKHGRRHRDNDLPAMVWGGGQGAQEWYVDGQLHRDGDRPAIVYAAGGRSWYVRGRRSFGWAFFAWRLRLLFFS